MQSQIDLKQRILDGAVALPDTMIGTDSLLSPPPSLKEETEYRKKVREGKGEADFLGAMYRTDGFIDNIMATLRGWQMEPDENWKPWQKDIWKELSKDVPEKYHGYLLDSTSYAHALYTKERITQKERDEELLGTMETTGNVARFAFGLVNPESLALGLATYGVGKVASLAKIASGVKSVTSAKRLVTTASQIENTAERAVQVERAMSALNEAAKSSVGRLGGFGTATATGTGINVGYEVLRQAVGYENDKGLVIQSALFGLIFSTPFAYVGARSNLKLANAAAKDLEAISVFRKLHTGDNLTDADLNTLRDFGYRVEAHRVAEATGHPVERPSGEAAGSDHFGLPEEHPISDEAIRAVEHTGNDPVTQIWDGQEHAVSIGDSLSVTKGDADFHGTVHRINHEDRTVVLKGEDGVVKRFSGEDSQLLGHVKQAPRSPEVRGVLAGLKTGETVRVDMSATLGIIKRRFEGSMLEPIIDRLMASGLDTKAYLSTAKNKKMRGFFSHADGSMAVYVGSKGSLTMPEARAFLHEAVHAHTAAALDGKLQLTAEQKAAVRDLKKLYSDVMARRLQSDHHGLTNVKEFVAEAMSNRKFQEYLSSIQVSNKPVLSSLWDKIKNILGLGERMDATALHRAIGLTDKLLGGGGEHPAPAVHGTVDMLPTTSLTGQPGTYMAKLNGIPIRFDIYAQLNASENPHIQNLAHRLVKDPMQNSDTIAQGITVSERKERMVRVITGMAHHEMKQAWIAAEKARGVTWRDKHKFEYEFYENVSRVARGELDVLHANNDIAPQLKGGAEALRKAFKTYAMEAQKAHLEGAEMLHGNDAYVNRVYLNEKISQLRAEHGDDVVHALFAEAFRGKYHGNVKFAEKFVTAIHSLSYKSTMVDMALGARDVSVLRHELAQQKMSLHEIDNIIETLFEAKDKRSDASKPGNLKFRMDIDETAKITLKDGTEVRFSDILENDARLLLDKYSQTMVGHIAFAQDGITSQRDWHALVRDAQGWFDAHPEVHPNKARDALQVLEDARSNIIGKPMSITPLGKFATVMSSMRAWSRSVFLGQLGLPAIGELKNTMGLCTWRATWAQMPSMRQYIGWLRNGIEPDNVLARQMQQVFGFGNEFGRQYARSHEVTDFTYNNGQRRFDNVANRAAHAIDIISGNATITAASRNTSAKAAAQHLYDLSLDAGALSGKRKRLVGWGIDDAHIDSTLTDLKKHSIVDQHGVVQQIEFETWAHENPKTHGDFLLATERMARDAIQDHNIGETWHFMHGPIGKILFELKTFVGVAHAKQFLKNIQYRDRTSAAVFIYGFVGEALLYATQASLNYAHDPEKLKEMLSEERIVAAAISRNASLGLFPQLLGEASQFVAGENYFEGGSANTGIRSPFETPTTKMIGNARTGVMAVGNALNPFANTTTTKQEVKSLLSVLPGSNTWGARNIIDMISEHYPKKEPNK